MSRQVPVTLTTMCMIRDGDRLLVIDRAADDWPGVTFPGGHVEPGESISQAAIREVLEETGLTVEAPILCGIKDWENQDGSRYLVFFYRADRFSGALRSSAEGTVFWIRRDQLHQCKLSLDFLKMLRIFEEDGLSEFFYRLEDGAWNTYLF